MMIILGVSIIGMLIRYYISTKIIIKQFSITIIINALSCLILGYAINNDYQLLIVLTSSISTYSTFNYEFISRFDNNKKEGFIYLTLSVVTSVFSLYIGLSM